MLRDHPLVRSPRPVDRTKTEKADTPEAFRATIREPQIDVMPLVRERKKDGMPGWCTYTYEHETAPELEVICGGVNHKSPRAGAIWRQGHLLHFGFEASPERMNETGQALLINAICYIARFTEDRPIVRTPCVFTQDKRIFDRNVIARFLARQDADPKQLEWYLDKDAYRPLAGRSLAEVEAWYGRVKDYLHDGPKGTLAVDVEAEALELAPAKADFFEKAFAALNHAPQAEGVRQLLRRYVPDGPGAEATVEQCRAWWNENQPYLFFSDTGGFRWHIDALARRRGIATINLRGPARATLPVLEAK